MVATVAASVMVIAVVASPVQAERSDMDASRPGRTFAPVVERTVEGDLLFAGSSNLPATDVDGDTTRICAGRAVATSRRRICADNSSSTELSLPPGARVIAARMYVDHRRPVRPPAARVSRRSRRRVHVSHPGGHADSEWSARRDGTGTCGAEAVRSDGWRRARRSAAPGGLGPH